MTTEETLISCLRVKGFGKTEALAEALDLPAETIEAELAELVAKGLAEPTRVGARLTANGRALALEAMRARARRARSASGRSRIREIHAAQR